jgi:hypothetical protein
VLRDLTLDLKDASPQPRALRHTKSSSSEFNTREYRPLYLLERNRKSKELEDEALPALPASGSPSLASTEDEWQSAVESAGPDSGVEDPMTEADQITPKAFNFPANVVDQREIGSGPSRDVMGAALEGEEQVLGPAFEETTAKALPRSASPLAASPAFDDTKMRDHTSRSRDASPSSSSSALQKVALSAAAGGLAALALGNRSPSPAGPRYDPDDFMGGDPDDETLELAAKSTPTPVSPPAERPALTRAPSSSLKKGGKKGKKESKSKSLDLTGETPKELSLEERKKIEEQDAADAVGDWFVDEPVTEKKIVEEKSEPIVVEEKEPDPNLLRRDSKGKGKKKAKAKPKKKGSISGPSTSPPPTPGEGVLETPSEEQADPLSIVSQDDDPPASTHVKNEPSASSYVPGSSKQYIPTFVDNEEDWAKNRAESVFTDEATLVGEQPAGFEKNGKEELRRKVLDTTAPAGDDDLNIRRAELNIGERTGTQVDDMDTLVSPYTETRDSQFFTPTKQEVEPETIMPVIEEEVEATAKGKKGKKAKKGKKGSVQVESSVVPEAPLPETKEDIKAEVEHEILQPAFADSRSLEESQPTTSAELPGDKGQEIASELGTTIPLPLEEKTDVQDTSTLSTLEPENIAIPVSPENTRDIEKTPVPSAPESSNLADTKHENDDTPAASTPAPEPKAEEPSIVKSLFSAFGWGKKRSTTPEPRPATPPQVKESPAKAAPSTPPAQEKTPSPIVKPTLMSQPKDLSEPLALAGIDSEISQLNEPPLATPLEIQETKEVESVDKMPQLDFGPASITLESNEELPRETVAETLTEPVVEEPLSSKKSKGKKDKKGKRDSIPVLPEAETKLEQEVEETPRANIEDIVPQATVEPQQTAVQSLSLPELNQTPTPADIVPPTTIEDEESKKTTKKGKKGKKVRQESVQLDTTVESEPSTPAETVPSKTSVEVGQELPALPPVDVEEQRDLSLTDEVSQIDNASSEKGIAPEAEVVVQDDIVQDSAPTSSKDKKKSKKGKGKKAAQIEPEVSEPTTPIEISTPIIEEPQIEPKISDSAVAPLPSAQEPVIANVEADLPLESIQDKQVVVEKAGDVSEPVQEVVESVDDFVVLTSKKDETKNGKKGKKGKKDKSADVVAIESAPAAIEPAVVIEEASRDIPLQEEPMPESEQLLDPVAFESLAEEASKDETLLPGSTVEDEPALLAISSKKDKKKKGKKGKSVDVADLQTPSDTVPSAPIVEEAAKELVFEKELQPEQLSESIPAQPLTDDLPKDDSLSREIIEPLIPAVEDEPATATTSSKKDKKKKKGKKGTSTPLTELEQPAEAVSSTPNIDEVPIDKQLPEVENLPELVHPGALTEESVKDGVLPEAAIEHSEPAVEDGPAMPSSSNKDKESKEEETHSVDVGETEPPLPSTHTPLTPVIEAAVLPNDSEPEQLPGSIVSEPVIEEPSRDVAPLAELLEHVDAVLEEEPVTSSSSKKKEKKKGKKSKSTDITGAEPSQPPMLAEPILPEPMVEEPSTEVERSPEAETPTEPVVSEPVVEEPSIIVEVPEQVIDGDVPTPSSSKRNKKKKTKGKSIDVTETEPSTPVETVQPQPLSPGSTVKDVAPVVEEIAVVEELPEPTVSEPIVSEPTVSEPTVSEPAVSEPIVSEPTVDDIATTTTPLPEIVEESALPTSTKKDKKKKGKKGKFVDVIESEPSMPIEAVQPDIPIPSEPIQVEHIVPEPVVEDVSAPAIVSQEVAEDDSATPTPSKKDKKKKGKKGKASEQFVVEEPVLPVETEPGPSESVQEELSLSAPVETEPIVPDPLQSEPVLSEVIESEQLPTDVSTQGTSFHEVAELATPFVEDAPSSSKNDQTEEDKNAKSIETTNITEPIEIESTQPDILVREPVSEESILEPNQAEPVIDDVSTPATPLPESMDRSIPVEDEMAAPTSKKGKKKKGKKGKAAAESEPSTPAQTQPSSPVMRSIDEDIVVPSMPLESEPLPGSDLPSDETQPTKSETAPDLAKEEIEVEDFAALLPKEDQEKNVTSEQTVQDNELASIVEPEPRKEIEPAIESTNETVQIVESPLDIRNKVAIEKTTELPVEKPADVVDNELVTPVSKKNKKKGKGKKSGTTTPIPETVPENMPVETAIPEPNTPTVEKLDDLPADAAQGPVLERTDDLPIEQTRDLPVEKTDEPSIEQAPAPTIGEEVVVPVSKNKKEENNESVSKPAQVIDLESSVDVIAKMGDAPAEQTPELVVEESAALAPKKDKKKKKKGKGNATALDTDTTPNTPTLEGPGTPALEQEPIFDTFQPAAPVSEVHDLAETTPLAKSQSEEESQITREVEPSVIDETVPSVEVDSSIPAPERKQEDVDEAPAPSKKDKKKGKKGKKAALQESEPSTPLETPIEAWKELVLDDVPFETPSNEKELVLDPLPIESPMEVKNETIPENVPSSVPEVAEVSQDVPVPEEVAAPMSAKERKKAKKGKKGVLIESEPSTPLETPIEAQKELVLEDAPLDTPANEKKEPILDLLPTESPTEVKKESVLENIPVSVPEVVEVSTDVPVSEEVVAPMSAKERKKAKKGKKGVLAESEPSTPLETPIEAWKELVLDDVPLETPVDEKEEEPVLDDVPALAPEIAEGSKDVPVQEEAVVLSAKDRKKAKKAKRSSTLISEPLIPLETDVEGKKELVLDDVPVIASSEENREVTVSDVLVSTPEVPEGSKDIPNQEDPVVDAAPLSTKDKKKAKKGKKASLSISESPMQLDTPVEEKKETVIEDLPITVPETSEETKNLPVQEEVVEEPTPVSAKDKKKSKKGKNVPLSESEPSEATETPADDLKQVALDDLPIVASELPEGTKDVQLQEDAGNDTQEPDVVATISAEDKKAKEEKILSSIDIEPSASIETPREVLKETVLDDQLASMPEIPQDLSMTPIEQFDETPAAVVPAPMSAKDKKKGKKGKKASLVDSEPSTPIEVSTPTIMPIESLTEEPMELVDDKQLIAEPEVLEATPVADDSIPVSKKEKKRSKKAKKGSVLEDGPSQPATPIDEAKTVSFDEPLQALATPADVKDEASQPLESSASDSKATTVDETPPMTETPAEVTEQSVPEQDDIIAPISKKDKKKGKKGKRGSIIEDEPSQPTETLVEEPKESIVEEALIPLPMTPVKDKEEPVALEEDVSKTPTGKKDKKKGKKGKKGPVLESEVSEPSTPSEDIKIDEVFGNSAQVRQLEDKEDSAHIMSPAEGNLSPNVVAPEVQLEPLPEQVHTTEPSLIEEKSIDILESPATPSESHEPNLDEWSAPSIKKEKGKKGKKRQSVVEEPAPEALPTVPETETLPDTSSTPATITEPLSEPQVAEEPFTFLPGDAASSQHPISGSQDVEGSSREIVDLISATPMVESEETPAAAGSSVPTSSNKKGKKHKLASMFENAVQVASPKSSAPVSPVIKAQAVDESPATTMRDKLPPAFEEAIQDPAILDSSISQTPVTEGTLTEVTADLPAAETIQTEETVDDSVGAPTPSKKKKKKEKKDKRVSTSEDVVQDPSIPIVLPETTPDNKSLRDVPSILNDELSQQVESATSVNELELSQPEHEPISSLNDVERVSTATIEPEEPVVEELASFSLTKKDKKKGKKVKGKQSGTATPISETVLESQAQDTEPVSAQSEEVEPMPIEEAVTERQDEGVESVLPPVEEAITERQAESVEPILPPVEEVQPKPIEKAVTERQGEEVESALPLVEETEPTPTSTEPTEEERALLTLTKSKKKGKKNKGAASSTATPTQEIVPENVPIEVAQEPALPPTEDSQPIPLQDILPEILPERDISGNSLPPTEVIQPTPTSTETTLEDWGLPTSKKDKKKGKKGKGKQSETTVPGSEKIEKVQADQVLQEVQPDIVLPEAQTDTLLAVEAHDNDVHSPAIPTSSEQEARSLDEPSTSEIGLVLAKPESIQGSPLEDNIQPVVNSTVDLEGPVVGEEPFPSAPSKKKGKKGKKSGTATPASENIADQEAERVTQIQPAEQIGEADDVQSTTTLPIEQEPLIEDKSIASSSKKSKNGKGRKSGTDTLISEVVPDRLAEISPPLQTLDSGLRGDDDLQPTIIKDPSLVQEPVAEDDWAIDMSKKKGKKSTVQQTELATPISEQVPNEQFQHLEHEVRAIDDVEPIIPSVVQQEPQNEDDKAALPSKKKGKKNKGKQSGTATPTADTTTFDPPQPIKDDVRAIEPLQPASLLPAAPDAFVEEEWSSKKDGEGSMSEPQTPNLDISPTVEPAPVQGPPPTIDTASVPDIAGSIAETSQPTFDEPVELPTVESDIAPVVVPGENMDQTVAPEPNVVEKPSLSRKSSKKDKKAKRKSVAFTPDEEAVLETEVSTEVNVLEPLSALEPIEEQIAPTVDLAPAPSAELFERELTSLTPTLKAQEEQVAAFQIDAGPSKDQPQEILQEDDWASSTPKSKKGKKGKKGKKQSALDDLDPAPPLAPEEHVPEVEGLSDMKDEHELQQNLDDTGETLDPHLETVDTSIELVQPTLTTTDVIEQPLEASIPQQESFIEYERAEETPVDADVDESMVPLTKKASMKGKKSKESKDENPKSVDIGEEVSKSGTTDLVQPLEPAVSTELVPEDIQETAVINDMPKEGPEDAWVAPTTKSKKNKKKDRKSNSTSVAATPTAEKEVPFFEEPVLDTKEVDKREPERPSIETLQSSFIHDETPLPSTPQDQLELVETKEDLPALSVEAEVETPSRKLSKKDKKKGRVSATSWEEPKTLITEPSTVVEAQSPMQSLNEQPIQEILQELPREVVHEPEPEPAKIETTPRKLSKKDKKKSKVIASSWGGPSEPTMPVTEPSTIHQIPEPAQEPLQEPVQEPVQEPEAAAFEAPYLADQITVLPEFVEVGEENIEPTSNDLEVPSQEPAPVVIVEPTVEEAPTLSQLSKQDENDKPSSRNDTTMDATLPAPILENLAVVEDQTTTLPLAEGAAVKEERPSVSRKLSKKDKKKGKASASTWDEPTGPLTVPLPLADAHLALDKQQPALSHLQETLQQQENAVAERHGVAMTEQAHVYDKEVFLPEPTPISEDIQESLHPIEPSSNDIQDVVQEEKSGASETAQDDAVEAAPSLARKHSKKDKKKGKAITFDDSESSLPIQESMPSKDPETILEERTPVDDFAPKLSKKDKKKKGKAFTPDLAEPLPVIEAPTLTLEAIEQHPPVDDFAPQSSKKDRKKGKKKTAVFDEWTGIKEPAPAEAITNNVSPTQIEVEHSTLDDPVTETDSQAIVSGQVQTDIPAEQTIGRNLSLEPESDIALIKPEMEPAFGSKKGKKPKRKSKTEAMPWAEPIEEIQISTPMKEEVQESITSYESKPIPQPEPTLALEQEWDAKTKVSTKDERNSKTAETTHGETTPVTEMFSKKTANSPVMEQPLATFPALLVEPARRTPSPFSVKKKHKFAAMFESHTPETILPPHSEVSEKEHSVSTPIPESDFGSVSEPMQLLHAKPTSPILFPTLLSEPTSQPTPKIDTRSNSPENNIDFAATLAAGLQESGFDSDIVLNDPAFHRSASAQRNHDVSPDDDVAAARAEASKSKFGVMGRNTPSPPPASPKSYLVKEIERELPSTEVAAATFENPDFDPMNVLSDPLFSERRSSPSVLEAADPEELYPVSQKDKKHKGKKKRASIPDVPIETEERGFDYSEATNVDLSEEKTAIGPSTSLKTDLSTSDKQPFEPSEIVLPQPAEEEPETYWSATPKKKGKKEKKDKKRISLANNDIETAAVMAPVIETPIEETLTVEPPAVSMNKETEVENLFMPSALQEENVPIPNQDILGEDFSDRALVDKIRSVGEQPLSTIPAVAETVNDEWNEQPNTKNGKKGKGKLKRSSIVEQAVEFEPASGVMTPFEEDEVLQKDNDRGVDSTNQGVEADEGASLKNKGKKNKKDKSESRVMTAVVGAAALGAMATANDNTLESTHDKRDADTENTRGLLPTSSEQHGPSGAAIENDEYPFPSMPTPIEQQVASSEAIIRQEKETDLVAEWAAPLKKKEKKERKSKRNVETLPIPGSREMEETRQQKTLDGSEFREEMLTSDLTKDVVADGAIHVSAAAIPVPQTSMEQQVGASSSTDWAPVASESEKVSPPDKLPELFAGVEHLKRREHPISTPDAQPYEKRVHMSEPIEQVPTVQHEPATMSRNAVPETTDRSLLDVSPAPPTARGHSSVAEPTWSFGGIRDSAVHVADPPELLTTPLFQTNTRDSGYHDEEYSADVAQAASEPAGELHEKKKRRSKEPKRRVVQSDQAFEEHHDVQTRSQSPSLPLNASVAGISSPSAIASATKERSSQLLDSSPSTRVHESPSISKQVLAPIVAAAAIGATVQHSKDVEVEPRHAERRHSKSRKDRSEPATSTSESKELGSTLGQIEQSEPHQSIFGDPSKKTDKPVPISTPSSKQIQTPRGQLDSIKEASPDDSPLHKKSRHISDVGTPDHRSLKTARRFASSPQPPPELAHLSRPKTPTPSSRRPIAPSVDASGRETPSKSSERHGGIESADRSMTLSPARRFPPEQRPQTPLTDPIKQRMAEERSSSVLSTRSITRHKTPDHLRPLSSASNRPSSPSLRRVERSISGDLRAASRLGEVNAPGAKSAHPNLAGITLAAGATAAVIAGIASSSKYDPVRDKGKGRADMPDVYVSRLY